MSTGDFVLGSAGAQAVPLLPHARKQVVDHHDLELDEFGLEQTQSFIKSSLPGMDPEKVRSRGAGLCLDCTQVELHMRCLYQNTPDRRMILGQHPHDEHVHVMCGFCGSGFQFAPAIAMFMSHGLLQGRANELNAQSARVKDVLGLFERMRTEFNCERFVTTPRPEQT